MKHCKACFATNTDSATICAGCKAPLDTVEPPDASHGYGESVSYRRTDTDGDPTSTIAPRPLRRHTLREPENSSRRSTIACFGPESSLRTPTVDEKLGRQIIAPQPQPQSGRRVTLYRPSSGEASEQNRFADAPSSAERKIVGVLVTYSWTNQGQVFPVREGRNLIGSDPQKCDIAVPQDDTLSAVNSHILFRKNFVIGDDVSMGGTDVNGEPVETAFVPLSNYARIRTGSTHWVFIAIEQSLDTEGAQGKAPEADR